MVDIPVRLIVVSPFTDPDRIITINWYLYLNNDRDGRFTEDTMVITFTPLRIGDTTVKNDFVSFIPTRYVCKYRVFAIFTEQCACNLSCLTNLYNPLFYIIVHGRHANLNSSMQQWREVLLLHREKTNAVFVSVPMRNR